MSPSGAPPPEVDVTRELVRDLLRAQHPDLAGLPLVQVATGWDNALWRLGDDLAVRLPVRALSAPLVEHEQRWLPALAPVVPVAVPTPVRVGRPGERYPWAWSVVPWLPGVPADRLTVAQRGPWAEQLAATLAALHRQAPPDAPANPFRGVPLTSRDDVVTARLDAFPEGDVLLRTWRDGVAAPAWDGPPVWLHGDPHPANLLVADGRLAALLDFGDVTAGDPASDLATAWLCFGPAARARFFSSYDEAATHAGDRATLHRRARAWAAALVPVLLADPVRHPGLAAVGSHAARQLRSPEAAIRFAAG